MKRLWKLSIKHWIQMTMRTVACCAQIFSDWQVEQESGHFDRKPVKYSQVKTTSSYWQSRTAVEHLSVENHFKTSFPKANNQVADLGQWHFPLYNPSKTKALPRLSCVLASVKGCTVLSRMVCMERWIEGATEEYQQATNRAPTGFFQGTDIDCLLLDD